MVARNPCAPSLAASVVGFVAGSCAGLATTPLDAAKTRIMLTAAGTRSPTLGLAAIATCEAEEKQSIHVNPVRNDFPKVF